MKNAPSRDSGLLVWKSGGLETWAKPEKELWMAKGCKLPTAKPTRRLLPISFEPKLRNVANVLQWEEDHEFVNRAL